VPEHGPARDTGGGVRRRLADISAAAHDLGWRPEISLRDGLHDLVAWWTASTAVNGSQDLTAATI
jgi:UDP-glucose 4-epimerase